jgi:glycosyltransferase involved in cell wall biosynthesis
MDINKCIATIASIEYSNYLYVFIKSILQFHSNDILIYIHLINYNKNEINKIQDLSKNIILSFENNILSKKINNINTHSEYNCYCINFRAEFILKILENNKIDYLFFIDSNTIIKKNINNFYIDLNNYDICAYIRNKNKTILGGIIGYKNTKNTKIFIKNWITEINNIGYYKWNSDQYGLYNTYIKNIKTIKIGKINEKYLGWTFKDDNYIWVAKGWNNKYLNIEFKKNQYQYLKKIDNVDIVLPTYKPNLKYLTQSIKSVINQTYKNWTLYVIDDGNTEEISKEIINIINNNEKIIYYKNPENKGLPMSLNIGNLFGFSEYICWTSDDNWYEPNFIEKMYEFIKINNYDFIHSFEYKHIINTNKIITVNPDLKKKFNHYGYLGASHMYKREIFYKTNGYDINLEGIEDLDFLWQIRHIDNNIKIGLYNLPLYNYRSHSTYLKDKIKNKNHIEKFKQKWNIKMENICLCKLKKCICTNHVCSKCKKYNIDYFTHFLNLYKQPNISKQFKKQIKLLLNNYNKI